MNNSRATVGFALGNLLLAVSIIGIGVTSIASRAYLAGLEVSGINDSAMLFSIASGALLVLLGSCLLVPASRRPAAIILTFYLLIWLIASDLPDIVKSHFTDGWTVGGETLAIAGVTMLSGREAWRRYGSWFFGVSLFIFGAMHYAYHSAVAGMVPTWIPRPLFWAYLTGTAMILGGVSVLSGLLARLAGILLAVMFFSWVVLIYVASLLSDVHSADTWANLFITLAMSAGGCLVFANADRRTLRSD